MKVLRTSFLMLGTMNVNSGRPSGRVRNTELRNDEQEASTNLESRSVSLTHDGLHEFLFLYSYALTSFLKNFGS